MTSSLFANLVLVLHLAFIAFVVGGGLLVWRRPRLAWLHLPAVAWGALVELTGWFCPLTTLEDRLRGNALGQDAGLIDRLLTSLIYPAGLTREIQWGLGLAVLALNLLVYGLVWRRHRRRS
ncbi:MAG: hypothetical protein BWK76_06510 [Desulfobulbaceae bacterium A2]|nr:MAG: hypothetical protein BWK76_06510 [Desulfobulbaceae bacterium A2]